VPSSATATPPSAVPAVASTPAVKPELTEDQRDTLSTVQESSRSLLALIDDVLEKRPTPTIQAAAS
jgi:hypothetical protein